MLASSTVQLATRRAAGYPESLARRVAYNCCRDRLRSHVRIELAGTILPGIPALSAMASKSTRSQRIMTKHASVLLLTFVAVFTGCSQLSRSTRDHDSEQARYVDATTLTSSHEHSSGDVITSVPLHFITAEHAAAELRADLPEGVRVALIGQSKSVLIQGPVQDVVATIEVLKTLDVR